MSLHNDYTIQILHDEKLAGFRAEAHNDRLARIASGSRQTWWRRLFGGPVVMPEDNATDWYRYPQVRHHGLKVGSHHVAR